MYRIEVARGEETVFRTIEELAIAIRNGVVTNRARIFHAASQKWLPIEFHPHYKKALELPASSPSAEPAHSKGPAPRSSGPRPTPAATPPEPVQHHPAPVQHHPSPAQHHPSPVQHHPSPVQHHPAPAQHQAASVKPQGMPIQYHLAPVSIPAPVPSPVLELTRATFTKAWAAEPEVALALEEPPPPPRPVLEEPAPSAGQPSRSWIRRPIQLTVIGAIAIVCTRVVVSAAAPGSETRSLAETAPRPSLGQTTTARETPVSDEKQPGAVLTAGPAFSPAIVTSAEAAKAPPPAPTAANRPAPAAAPADSIHAIDAAPTAVDLTLPTLPPSDSLAAAPTTSDSGAIGRILRAVTSTKPAPIKAAAQ
jgi:hypothetical protein